MGVLRQRDAAGGGREFATAMLKTDLNLVEHWLMARLGGLAVVLAGLIVAALHYWPPGHGG
jgi:hypothetical protein